jgi:5-oxoprolinase (ATP-hydrolysing) subunit A
MNPGETMKRINLNADLGESFGAWTMGEDDALLQVVGSASIACGFHAGDPMVMRRTVRRALDAGVSLGAHPAWPDLQGFGRRPMQMSATEVEALVIYQIGALAAMAAAEGGRLTHVKPHGALSNQACEDDTLAAAIARAVRAVDHDLILLAPALSALHSAGERAGLKVASEIFADRAYSDAGTLLPRSQAGAVLHDAAAIAAHTLGILAAGGIVSASGKTLPCRMDSICVHGDTPDAAANARQLKTALQQAGWQPVTLPELLA